MRWLVAVDVALMVMLAGGCGNADSKPENASSASEPATEPTTTSSPANVSEVVPTAPLQPLVTTDLEFIDGHTLDVVGADPSVGGRPVVVVIRPADHVELGQFLPTLVATGAVVFDAPVRPIEQGGRYPVAFEEVSCAVGFAREYAADFGGDPATITVLAHSAGSYIASLISFRTYEGNCTANADAPDQMVGIAGISGALTPDELASQDAQIADLVGGPIDEHPDAYSDLQLVNHLGERLGLRIMLFHGTEDKVVPVEQTSRWNQMLVEAGYEVSIHIVEGADHTSLLVDSSQAGDVAALVAEFAKQ